MVHSSLEVATRVLVSVLLVLARSYLVVLEVNRDSPPEQVLKSYRKVLLKVHPDKGGQGEGEGEGEGWGDREKAEEAEDEEEEEEEETRSCLVLDRSGFWKVPGDTTPKVR
jgi:hypothetical protein